MTVSSSANIPFRISVLVFIKDLDGRILLIKRNKSPNLGCWSPPGGKLEMKIGESPFECAIRETLEETAHSIDEKDLHLFGMVSEKSYEGTGHWLMFLFDCKKELLNLPPDIDEGSFRFFSRKEIDQLELPPTDRSLLWPNWDKYRKKFIALRANCNPASSLQIVVEELH